MTLANRQGTGAVVPVERNDQRFRAGQGTAAGLSIVFRKFRKALFGKPNSDRSDTEGQFNVQYPEERLSLPEAYRNMPILLFDDATGHELCTSCFQCERVCPPQVIHITQAKDPATGKPVPSAAEFIIEYDTCMSCGYCAEVCPFDAIKMDHDYELSTSNHPELDVNYNRLLRPVSYYETIAPTLWNDVRESAMKKLQNNIKRRPGAIGVDHGQKVGAKAAPAAVARPADPAGAGASAVVPAAKRAPVAAIGKTMSEEKLAKLQSIRADNQAKRGGAGAPVDSAHAVEAAVGVQPDTAQVAAPDAATPGSVAPGATGPVAAVGTSMSEEKRAKLEAIRAAKRAQGGE
ncbi:MAG: 4Fe-4S binding protein [Herpetosiphonaceae bacterium]|nr:4Fe-4S binding protein [Herpetosiphonaceae bacterium]